MNTPALLLTVLALVYALFFSSTAIAFGSWAGGNKVTKFNIKLGMPLFIVTLLLSAAYAADTYL